MKRCFLLSLVILKTYLKGFNQKKCFIWPWMVQINKLFLFCIKFNKIKGVAPRAKMNQQRARRFRTAQDREKEKLLALKKGIVVSDDAFDSNCITPGKLICIHVYFKIIIYFLRYRIYGKINTKFKIFY
ncbi:hypothetical protein K502DRAFT_253124 [Neoconidiobolus thromboides FSU 785]|nr:hypothetical protein K502DRAFT_253124 [Neoconidiobolus thromboides FSU 785]